MENVAEEQQKYNKQMSENVGKYQCQEAKQKRKKEK